MKLFRKDRQWLMWGVCLLALAVATGWLLRPSPTQSAQTGPPPDAATTAAFAAAGCGGCHTIPGVPNAIGEVGPNLSTIGFDAATRKDDLSAEAYIRESILQPAAFLAPQCPAGDCPPGVMPPNFGERLSAAEIDVIVAYLLSLQGEGVAAPTPTTAPPVPELISAGRPPEAAVVPFAEPPKSYSDAEVILGQFLFFDPRLSGDATLSCASCHQPDQAWSDGAALNRGYPGTGYFRNAPTVMNTVYAGFLYWDGRMDGADMPTLVRDHLTEAHFMNSDGRLMVERVKQVPEYVAMFQEAYGRNPSFGRVLNAITAYVHSLNSGPTPYDRFLAGETDALSSDAEAGLPLFEANCAACHSGPALSDDQFYVSEVPDHGDIWADPLRHISFRRFFRQLGVPNYRALATDPGLYALTKDLDDWGAFRTAPLREVGRTAPYMHNGALPTLEAVVRFYDERDALGLSETEVRQLVAFLESLSSEPVAVTAPQAPPYQLRTLGDNE